jgi:pimeloyl-ACP methyl ester carboxylesterase
MAQRKWLWRFVNVVRGMSRWAFLRIVISRPECSIMDLPNILRGALFSAHSMWEEVSKLNLVKAAPALKMPVFFFVGRHDHVVAPEISVAYFDALQAPSKKLVWFEESGHCPPFEETAKFNQTMAELVRPVGLDSVP